MNPDTVIDYLTERRREPAPASILALASELDRDGGVRLAADFLAAANIRLSTALYWLTGSLREVQRAYTP